jgi:hypothetical protein
MTQTLGEFIQESLAKTGWAFPLRLHKKQKIACTHEDVTYETPEAGSDKVFENATEMKIYFLANCNPRP